MFLRRTLLLGFLLVSLLSAQKKKPVAAPVPSNDEAYGEKIRQFTTEKHFLTELIDHLPASATLPTPEKFLGYIPGAPGKLTHSATTNRYMRALAAASKRVQVFRIGDSEEGREMIMVAISDEENLAKLDLAKADVAKLADPRRTSEAEAQKLINSTIPMYWITGALHAPETGSTEMLIELAYRLAAGESDHIRAVRKNVITLITPVLDPDGREKQVDLYNWTRANEGKPSPGLLYWGKYVVHDNNRDGMNMSLALTRDVTKTFLEYHPLVMHDLHESIPFLYISTGMGPYNAWLDPIVTQEWQKMAWHEVEEMTKRGVPGVWTHGFYDGWAANYLFYAANGHNAIGRFYETYGAYGGDVGDRVVPGNFTTRTWFRPNPPTPRVRWSLRNNINLQQSGVLLALKYTADHKQEFLSNFWKKSQRSVAKATTEGPAAWVLPAKEKRPAHQADLVRVLQQQGVEVHKLSSAATVKQGSATETIPAGSYIVRMDQPYSRMADMMLDRQYYNSADTRPYDDTGWSLAQLRNIRSTRVMDTALLKEAMTLQAGTPVLEGSAPRSNATKGWLLPYAADYNFPAFRFKHKSVKMFALESPLTANGVTYPAGSVWIPMDSAIDMEAEARSAGLKMTPIDNAPTQPMHELAAPRVAVVHTWMSTQQEGWVRLAFENSKAPYTYISDHVLRDTPRLKDRFDVILFGPVNSTAQRIVNGVPKRSGPAIPWKNSELTPSFATSPDQTDDIRGGMGLEGLVHLKRFIEEGGLFITIGNNASIPIDFGLVEGVSFQQTRELAVRGSILRARVADTGSPVLYGYDPEVPVYFNQTPVLAVSESGMDEGAAFGPAQAGRVTGRGGLDDPDVVQGRPYSAPPPPVNGITDEVRNRMRAYLPAPDETPRVLLRFSGESDLLISGMLSGGRELAGKATIVDAPLGKGHILMFANNPMWRHQTQGSFGLVFNAIMNYQHLHIGRKAAPARAPQSGTADQN
jgi:hypothetical protein